MRYNMQYTEFIPYLITVTRWSNTTLNIDKRIDKNGNRIYKEVKNALYVLKDRRHNREDTI